MLREDNLIFLEENIAAQRLVLKNQRKLRQNSSDHLRNYINWLKMLKASFARLSNKSRRNAAVRLVFDEVYYLNRYPDVKKFPRGPFHHYSRYGFKERRSPNLFFDADWYLRTNPTIVVDANDSLVHYLTTGEKEGRWPHPIFNPAWYLEANPDVLEAGMSPLLHFLSHGLNERREFSPFFSLSWYESEYPETRQSGIHPGVHFLTVGNSGNYNPGTHFSCDWYKSENPDVVAAGVHPYLHFLEYGREEGRSPLPYVVGLNTCQSDYLSEGTIGLSNFDQLITAEDYEPSLDNSEGELNFDISGAKLVSFDVWSTLLHRECYPDEVKLQSARYLLLNAYDSLRPAFQSLRELYWSRIRAENRSAPNNDFEYRFANAVDVWLNETLQPSVSDQAVVQLKGSLLAHEFECELRCTHRDDRTAKFIEKLRQPYVFASDFYTSADFVRKLLKSHGVGGLWSKAYCSSDSFESKRSGALFKRILSDFALQPSELAHFGDNPDADGSVPRSLGISASLYKPIKETDRSHWYRDAFEDFLQGDLSKHQRRILAILEGLCKASEKTHRVNSDLALFQIGIRLSPIVFSFCLSVFEDAVKNKIDNIFFFTREGIFLKEVYDAISRENPYITSVPKSSILAVSRRATFAASIKNFDIRDMMRLWTMYTSQSFRGFAFSLNLDEDLLRRVCQRHGVQYEKSFVHPWMNEDFLTVLNDSELTEHARESIRAQQFLLKGYLEQEGLQSHGDTPTTIVDIGWRGTIQDNIARILDRPINGHYLALFKFLNEQCKSGRKFGWLNDDNVDPEQSIPDQVAPIEMIYNGRGGSVVSYKYSDGTFYPVKEIIENEEKIVEELKPLQAGMLAAVPYLSRYIGLHGLLAEHLKPLARQLNKSLINSPPMAIADLFSRLEHNETFGAGLVDEVGRQSELTQLREANSSREMHYILNNWLGSVRWRNGAIRQSAVAKWWAESATAYRSAAPLAITQVYSPAVNKMIGERLAIYAPGVLKASGGHRTIFNVVKRLSHLGLEPFIFLDGEGAGLDVVEEYLAGTRARLHTNWRHNIASTVAFATIACSAEFVRQNVVSQHKFYLVQDAEAFFNPVGDNYIMAENSYSQGLNHITIGNWLTHLIQNQYNAPTNPAGLGIDTTIYRLAEHGARDNAVCMLYQPEKPRRGNILGLAALRILKQRNPGIRIYLYGSNERIETDFEAEQLGVISDLRQLNALYNNCRAGICISLSNPSRIPFEMMAAGCIPVDVYRYNNLMDYEDETAILAYQSPASIADALEIAVEKSASERDFTLNLATKALRRTLDWENDTIVGHVLATVENSNRSFNRVCPAYLASAVISKSDQSPTVDAFCHWQLRLAKL
ncbi:hypothetical protein N2601_25040 (plasmid) [Rhizobium sp. CB3060]|uniref:rhamnosyltransferase WsaF family glycosyltransferase n=1 Tax=Rhizobium sp. CB3060 TaxID=3138255 RepID=UPI0021A8B285|nr:HAD family hydrolase [Rhizobium tropici]UWU23532.1 hypothetical protein N2601_25040 [Rhizobium tropici]